MPKLPKLSGREAVKILSRLGFVAKRQRGSHVIMIKISGDQKVGCVVPMHKELKIGTLKGILEQAEIAEEEFLELV